MYYLVVFIYLQESYKELRYASPFRFELPLNLYSQLQFSITNIK